MSNTPLRPRQTVRKQRAADAAIEVIAADGLRGLTHRAVDVRADLPSGSTSSCFRTRLALLKAVLDRMVELDSEMLDRIPVSGWSLAGRAGRAAIVDMLTGVLEYALGPARSRTIARLELYLDATRHRELEAELIAANRGFVERVAAGMRAANVADPERAARLLTAQLDGLLYDALARPFLDGGDRDTLRRGIEVIVHGYTVPGLRGKRTS
ncbi:hypothetical protein BAY61_22210 [Prauserella marina]|uniref:DNA-binding transcriptional regulator YbjK n=1 Tax=Prauserella marina TaxID=530584 RepID=A0A222VTP4_9PSEU|nr:TetR/AcrR family transcriptional regulator [Prauserella marina]ASR37260.1 hypothetical protein BAY61_22210 [Prauserella marina]PWV72592.1 TetR family transcriptional regulator [Prauserella marina]SDD76439.1 DNA-binding transcriptional regulator YbjK [Prauserella marina]